MPRVGTGYLYGKSMVGKSLAALRLAASIAYSVPFVIDPERPTVGKPLYQGATLLIAGEDIYNLRARIEAAERILWKELASFVERPKLPIIPVGLNSQLTGTDQLDEIYRLTSEARKRYEDMGLPIRLVVFDTISSAFRIANENDNPEMGRIINTMGAYGQRFDAFSLGISHPDKEGKVLRGASAQLNGLDILMKAARVSNTCYRDLTMEKIKNGDANGKSYRLKQVITEDVPAIIPTLSATQEKDAELEQKAPRVTDMERIEAAMQDEAMPSLNEEEQIATLCNLLAEDRISKGNPSPVVLNLRKQVVSRSLPKLVEKGILRREPDGRYVHDKFYQPDPEDLEDWELYDIDAVELTFDKATTIFCRIAFELNQARAGNKIPPPANSNSV